VETVDGSPAMRQTVAMMLSVLVCDPDELARRALGRVLVEHGHKVTAEATTAVETVQLSQAFDVDLVVISNELQGLPGLDVVAELEAAGRRVILVSNDAKTLEQARESGAFFAVERGDLDNFERAIGVVGKPQAAGDRRSGVDRRSGADRRMAQDWGKVISERRTGSDRRQGDRRGTGDARALGA
jgi:CheY-like chemotaxis protein